jgi:aspartyl-tRNA(Asn)/glutamyl-tRNA(Gln) amidotransferase subunit B
VAKAIDVEIERQREILEKGQVPAQETRGWDENKNTTLSQRSKEEAHDYRYFPEPDIPPIVFSDKEIEKIKADIPELPEKKRVRFANAYNLTDYDADILTREQTLSDYYEQAIKDGSEYKLTPKQIANFIINRKPDIESIVPAELVKRILASQNTAQVSSNDLNQAIKRVFLENEKAVEDYKAGKMQILGFLIGKVRALLPANSSTSGIKEAIDEALK